MQTVLIIFHIVACSALILIVLLQTGRGAEMGAAFGGSSQTLFGSTGGTTFLGKLTTLAAVVFMLTCLGLTYFSAKPHTESVMEEVQVPPQPAIPEAKPVQPAGQAETSQNGVAQPAPAATPQQESAKTPAAGSEKAPETDAQQPAAD